ncbi:multidrug ABC transporter ATPase [Halococcus thailandensis JCM 13552]|uniref:Multidrug ABC transporter ATPase n=1 Tax=Halococcus thailandensis JCM 13552 TaxID=1227457 RepID=M0NEU0_9EURY|nr:multidrug ABC transporter ATPase [Halococcus thailandensis JCM 13552]
MAAANSTQSDVDSETAIALRALDISRSFGNVSVLDGVSVSVEQGELVAIVGPNGSGKSTLMEVIAGVRSPDAGSVIIPADGRTNTNQRDVGYLPQRPAFREGFTVRETLQFYARFLDETGPTDVNETLQRVGLRHVSGRNVGSLSGGMTRLLGLGQAILGHPSVLVLDEPGSGLDPTMVERLFSILHSLADDGTGIVVASHHLAAIETYADTVAFLDRGGLLVSESPTQLLASTGQETLVDAFLASMKSDEHESTVRAGFREEETD